MTDLIFRKASHADVPQIVTLVNSVYRGENSKKGWTTEADLLDGQRADEDMILNLINKNNSTVVLALSKTGQICGSVHLENKQTHAYLGMLSVSVHHQNQKIGAKLIEECEKIVSKEWGLPEIQMTVITVRFELLEYYERRGYLRTGELIDFPTDKKFGILKKDKLYLEVLKKSLKA